MSKKIKSIEITFENCDGVTIPFECIRYISLRNITENLCASSFSKKFNRTKEIGNLFVSFNDKFDLLVCSFTGDSAKDRILKHNDITQISVIYEDGESEWFFVNWKSDTEDNPLQRTYEEDGFCLEIGE